MHTEQAKNMKAELKRLFKKDDWLECMDSTMLEFLAHQNGDLTETVKTYEKGRKRTVLRPEAKNRYLLYRLLRTQKRCPKNQHAESVLKTMEGSKK